MFVFDVRSSRRLRREVVCRAVITRHTANALPSCCSLCFSASPYLGLEQGFDFRIHNKNISAYDIAEVSFEVDSTNYVTDEAHLPADSKVVGNTWLNVNSDGSPDRRYKHNMPCLICEFGKLRISSDTGLDVLFLLSNADNVEQFKSILPQ